MKRYCGLRAAIVLFLLPPTWSGDTSLATVKVLQPPALNVTTGETAVLNCTFENQELLFARATWVRTRQGGEAVEPRNPEYKDRLKLSTIEQNKQGEAMMSIANSSQNDSGTYYCEIELTGGDKTHVLARGMGGGTRLEVQDLGNQGQTDLGQTESPWKRDVLVWSWAIRLVLAFLLVAGGLLGCFLSKCVAI